MSYQTKKMKDFQNVVNKVESYKDSYKNKDLLKESQELKSTWKNTNDNQAKALALVSLASEQACGMIPFETQMLCALALYDGNIAEMKTGEGKTLAAVLASYLYYLNEGTVWIVSVNDYLTQRDSEFASPILELLGVSCDFNISRKDGISKQRAYKTDVLYITNREVAFDYLRNNLSLVKNNAFYDELPIAIIDEVDSILIDEARNPFIISNEAESPVLFMKGADDFAKLLSEDMYKIDLKRNSIYLTDSGIQFAEKHFKIDDYASEEFGTMRGLINNALDANYMKKNGVDYIVKENAIVLVDQATGRLSFGKQLMHGLHQAIEMKEGLPIAPETKTTSSITFQYLFKLFKKISGMTGTALTDKEEFGAIYNLPVLEIPLRLPLIRNDQKDCIFLNDEKRNQAVVDKICELHEQGRPVLIGTTSVYKSEIISDMLKARKIPHEVLNAKQHERESEIIAKAGQKGAVTISTNMAGRGTDIILGEGVKELGGLFVLGTERHESRRIDNQLRGRSGRQGDPGDSCFFTSLDDEVIKRFGSDQLSKLLSIISDVQGSDAIQNPMFDKLILSSQKMAEGANFDSRKSTLKYNTVINKQYHELYKTRMMLLWDEIDLNTFIEKVFTKEKEDKKKLVEIVENISDERKERLKIDILRLVDENWTDYLQNVEKIKMNSIYSSYKVADPFNVYVEDCVIAYSKTLQSIRKSIVEKVMSEEK